MKKTIIKTILTTVLIFSLLSPAFAATPVQEEGDFSAFKSVYNVNLVDLPLPKPLRVTLPNAQNFGVAVIETKTQKVQPIELTIKESINYPSVSVTSSSSVRGNVNYFVDRDSLTVAEFDLDADQGNAWIKLSFSKDLKSSELVLELDDNVAPPYMISIEAEVDGEWITVLSNVSTYGSSISFPERVAKNWKINFTHSQPLRLREITLKDKDLSPEEVGTEIIWLAKPGETYQIYADAAVYKYLKTGELGNLLENPDDILQGSIGPKQENSAYKDPDSDFDGIPDYRDNCVNLSNEKQEDLDNNKRGDACEDHDKDGVMNSSDNCPQDPNSNQKDTDGDGIGDVCDSEESRPTEKMPWLPWVGMGGAAIVVIGIVFMALKKEK